MIRKWMVAVPFLAILAWAAGTQQDAKTVISSATTALGADNLKTIEFSGSGFDYVIGQAPNPSSPWPKFIDKTYTRVVDLDAPASRMQRIRTQGENPPRGGGQQPIVGEQTQNQVVAAGSPQAASLQDELMMTLPYSFLRSAAAASDAGGEIADHGRKEIHRSVLHRPEQGRGARLLEQRQPDRKSGDQDRQQRARRYSLRDRIFGLQGLRRRKISDSYRAKAGRLPSTGPDGDGRETKRAGQHRECGCAAGRLRGRKRRRPKSSATACI